MKVIACVLVLLVCGGCAVREHAFLEETAFVNGLAPASAIAPNAAFMDLMQNAKASKYGAVFPPVVTNPFPNDAASFPFPQLFLGERCALWAKADEISRIAKASTWMKTPLRIVNSESGADLVLTPGDLWQFVSFQDLWFLSNGAALVCELPYPIECIQNGSFDTADHWTLTAPWAWEMMGQRLWADEAAPSALAVQLEADQLRPFVVGRRYRVVFTIVNSDGLGAVRACVGSTGYGTARTFPGTYAEVITCAGSTDFSLLPVGDYFSGRIDNVSVVALDDLVVLGSEALSVQAICRHNNRFLLGGLSGAWFETAEWARVVQAWKDTLGKDEFTHKNMAFDNHWIVWGERGGGAQDYPFQLLLTALGFFGQQAFLDLEEIIIDAVETGEIGFVPVPMDGDIQALASYENRVNCYTSAEIVALTSVENRYVADTIKLVGTIGRGAVAGDEAVQVLMDNDHNLWRGRAGQGFENLERKQYFGDFGAPLVSYDPLWGDFWISRASFSCVQNGAFASSSYWTLSGWTIGSGKLSAANASITTYAKQVAADQAHAILPDHRYQVTYTLTRTAGGIRVCVGNRGLGTARAASGTYTEIITCAGATLDVVFRVVAAPFTGNVDDVSVVDLGCSYILSETGLGGPVDVVQHGLQRDPELGLLAGSSGTGGPFTMKLRTVSLDFGYRDFKHISEYQVQAAGLSSMHGAVAYKMSTGEYVEASPVPFNADGVAFPNASFVDGKAIVSGVAGVNATVSRLEIRYNPEGRRYIRGTRGIAQGAGE